SMRHIRTLLHRRAIPLAAYAFCFAAVLISGRAAPQRRRLSIGAVLPPRTPIDATSTPRTCHSPVSVSRLFLPRPIAADATRWGSTRVNDGSTSPRYDADRLQGGLVSVERLDGDEARRLARPRTPVFDGEKREMVFTASGDLFAYEFSTNRLVRLTNDALEEHD